MGCVATPTVDEVRATITTSLTDAQIQLFIDDAVLVASQCASFLGFDASRQQAIVRWLTAHLLSTVMNKGGGNLTAESLGDASKSYGTSALGKELRSTMYGNAALQLDPSGCLARLGKARATFQVV